MPQSHTVYDPDFIAKLYGGASYVVHLLKRNDNQQQGTVVDHLLFDCVRGEIQRTGQTIKGSMQGSHRCTWTIPRSELERVGVNHLNPGERIVEEDTGWTWSCESTVNITEKIFEQIIQIECLRLE